MASKDDINDQLGDEFVRITLSDTLPDVPQLVRNAAATVGDQRPRPSPHEDHSPIYKDLLKHSSAPRVDTDIVLFEAIKKAHPGSAVVASRDYRLQPFGFPHARVTRLPKTELNTHQFFAAPAQRGSQGGLILEITFGCFVVEWDARKYLMYVAKFREGDFATVEQFFYVHENETAIQALLVAIGTYADELHDQIPVFAHGWWEPDHQLWLDVQKANWDDVILDPDFKKRLQDDVSGFFSSEKIYKDLAIPWKRGIIFLGPPGNGKTISLKAVMKESPHPSLYVKNFNSYAGEEYAMQMVFDYARRKAPCILVLEDLDSLITDRNRSFFLNEIDGLQGNDGLLIIGTTNHFDRLDPALSNRPSRFDRKFEFDNPTRDERVLYAQYWQNKLKDNKTVSFPDSLVQTVADLTERFSFAYIKEAMVSTLVILAGGADDFEKILKEQIAALRKSIEPEKPDLD
ncbi:hypothetical protein FRB99_001306 [Tulasnella sp. 403]|nr:hypothetical protein FRB99_001306 [Tulasnella sp. 403]